MVKYNVEILEKGDEIICVECPNCGVEDKSETKGNRVMRSGFKHLKEEDVNTFRCKWCDCLFRVELLKEKKYSKTCE